MTTVEPAVRPTTAAAPDPGRTPTRLGFACSWTRDPVSTWSGTPWSLRQALSTRSDVTPVDLGVHPSRRTTATMQAASLRRHAGRWVSPWRHSTRWRQWVEDAVRAAADRSGCDAVLEIGDLVALDQPFGLYQDLCYDTLLEVFDEEAGAAQHFPGLGLDDLRRCRDRQHDIYQRASAVFAMSHWLAGELVRHGVDADKVHVVHPGMETPPTSDAAARRRLERPHRRLLLVGRDFHTKGGDAVVAAVERLRRDVDPAITLTIVGPRTWPMDGPIPAGVFPIGAVAPGQLATIWEEHDLLVMPSRLEGFGKVFAEALAAGLPCIGRDAYAMPEIITAGHNGSLVAGDDPDELAGAIVDLLADEAIYRTCFDERAVTAAHYSWSRAADQMAGVFDGLRAGR